MARPEPNHDSTLDARLRAVPLPAGFVDRLRQSLLTDEELDSAIRSVPMAADFLDRIRQSVLSDEELDAIVRAESPPSGMLERIRRTAFAEDASEQGPDVEMPRPLRPSRHLRRRSRKPMRATRWAVGISLVLGLTIVYVGTMTGLFWSKGPSTQFSKTLALLDATKPANWSDREALLIGDPPTPTEQPTEETQFAQTTPTPAPAMRFSPIRDQNRSWLSQMEQWFGAKSSAPLADAQSLRWGGVFASHRPFDELPELKKAAGLTSRGISWPLVSGANNAFLLRFGVHPFVAPAAHPKLQTSIVPLNIDASSYELTRRWLDDGELPPPQLVRTEDFLAALDYEFPRPNDQPLSLTTAAGPSPFGAPGIQLLQIGVQAASRKYDNRPAGMIVLAVDVSASMNWGGRLDMVRQALGKLIPQLGKDDRLSLIAFSEGAEVLVEDAGAEDAGLLLAAVQTLRIRSSTNIGTGLSEAYAVAQAMAADHHAPVRVVLITDGLAELDRRTVDRIEKQLVASTEQKIYLDVVDLGREVLSDAQLPRFAQFGRGALYQAANADQIRRSILEILTGQSQKVAQAVVLKTTFRSGEVVAYRLFGHEQQAFGSSAVESLETDFHADQSATVLYELQLKPNGGDPVASIELSWQPPGGGSRQSITRTISRGDFASDFSSSAPSLQGAAIAAGAAEVLRDSPFAKLPPYANSINRILQLANQVDSRVSQQSSFKSMMKTLERANRAKPYRGGGRFPQK